MVYESPRFLAGGDKALFIEFGNSITPELNRRVRQLMLAIQNAGIPVITEAVPTYRSLLVYYNPLKIGLNELRETLDALVQKEEDSQFLKPKATQIPIIYGGEYGPDLEFVAKQNGLSVKAVVQIHTSNSYLIYMLGFIPGFAYLGGMSPRIATQRLETPRIKIPAGSVGIAGNQTGIYPAESPGGWHLIGRTPLKLFDSNREPPALLQAGNYVTFVSITAEEFAIIREEVEQGIYVVKETPVI
ncbi:5-oxoprolinase subunit PxpB [Chloroflexota bacterium]